MLHLSEHSLMVEIHKLKSSKDKINRLFELDGGFRSRVFLRLSVSVQKELLGVLKFDESLSLLKFMDPDEVTDVLQRVDAKKQRRLLEELQEDVKHKVEFLLRFHPESAAGLMSLDYVLASLSSSISSVIRLASRHERRTGRFPVIVVEENGLVVGELRSFILSSRNVKEKVSKHVSGVKLVRYDASQDDVVKAFRESLHDKVVVIDDFGSIVGVIFSDDVLRLLQEEPVKSLYSFAGLKKEESPSDSVKVKVFNRYRWLIVSLLASFLVAASISPFESTIEGFVLLAVYLPIVAMIGGNAATQTLAVVVRGLALNQIDSKIAKKLILKETLAGFINGLIIGVLVGIISYFLSGLFMFGVVIFLAMVFNLVIAGIFGSVVPLLIKRFGRDPATSATIFITTATDIFGFFFFLSLAYLLI